MSRMLALACALAAFALAAGSASAQQPTGPSQPAATPPYGPPITLEQAKRVMAAAELEAAKNSWQVAIAILNDTHIPEVACQNSYAERDPPA